MIRNWYNQIPHPALKTKKGNNLIHKLTAVYEPFLRVDSCRTLPLYKRTAKTDQTGRMVLSWGGSIICLSFLFRKYTLVIETACYHLCTYTQVKSNRYIFYGDVTIKYYFVRSLWMISTEEALILPKYLVAKQNICGKKPKCPQHIVGSQYRSWYRVTPNMLFLLIFIYIM